MSKILGVVDLYPEPLEKGVARIVKYEITDTGAMLHNMRAVRDGGSMFRVVPGEYCKLIVEHELMMSDTPMERQSNFDFIANAKGRVLIAGLGIGMILRNVLDRENITEIVIIEKYQDVIDLVAPKFNHPKVKIICADIFEWLPADKEKFDTIYFDIWPHISEDNLDEMSVLHKRFRKFKAKGCWMESWLRQFLQKKRNSERRKEREYQKIAEAIFGKRIKFNDTDL